MFVIKLHLLYGHYLAGKSCETMETDSTHTNYKFIRNANKIIYYVTLQCHIEILMFVIKLI